MMVVKSLETRDMKPFVIYNLGLLFSSISDMAS